MKDFVLGALRLARDIERSLGERGSEEVKGTDLYSVATRTDLAISDAVLEYVRRSGLAARSLDEERGEVRFSENPQYTVALDPVDGTINNARGKNILPTTCILTVFDSPIPKFSDALAAGIICLPTGDIWYAERGRGLEFNGKSTRTIGSEELTKNTIVIVDRCINSPYNFSRLDEKAFVRDYGSAGLHFAGVSGGPRRTGMFDAFVHPSNKTHELGAGYLMLKEAGGWVADFDGQPFDDRRYDFNAMYPVVAAATEKLGRQILGLIERL